MHSAKVRFVDMSYGDGVGIIREQARRKMTENMQIRAGTQRKETMPKYNAIDL